MPFRNPVYKNVLLSVEIRIVLSVAWNIPLKAIMNKSVFVCVYTLFLECVLYAYYVSVNKFLSL
jgi:hypothetical protein